MGVKFTVNGKPIPTQAYTVNEASTPLLISDSTGHVGQMTIGVSAGVAPAAHMLEQGSPVALSDTRRGLTTGELEGISFAAGGGLASITCLSRLAVLNIYNADALPYAGTLGGALAYYFSLAGVTTGFQVDPDLASRPVTITGWTGELWYNLKALAAAHQAEIALVGDQIVVRKVRERMAIAGRTISANLSLPGTQLARAVEVYHYQTEPIYDRMVYPPEGWTGELQILTAPAGEFAEYELEVQASLTSVVQPVIMETIGPDDNDISGYTVVGDDGLPVNAAAWNGGGGQLEVAVSSARDSIIVKVRGATGLPNANGGEIKTFSIAMASDSGSNQYSTLRVLGSGVAVRKTKYTFSTTANPARTQQEVGITVDNPFLTDINDVYSAGCRLASEFSGGHPSLNGTVSAINEIGDRGEVRVPTVAQVQEIFDGLTGAQVEAHSIHDGKTIAQIDEYWKSVVQDNYENQVFGNAAGARVWNKDTRRFYRIRNVAISPNDVQFDAEDDLTCADMQDRLDGLTCADAQGIFDGMTSRDVDLAGIPA